MIRGARIANVYAALLEGVDRFEKRNRRPRRLSVCRTFRRGRQRGDEEVAFLCARLGIATGIDLDLLLDAAALPKPWLAIRCPSRLARAGVHLVGSPP